MTGVGGGCCCSTLSSLPFSSSSSFILSNCPLLSALTFTVVVTALGDNVTGVVGTRGGLHQRGGGGGGVGSVPRASRRGE